MPREKIKFAHPYRVGFTQRLCKRCFLLQISIIFKQLLFIRDCSKKSNLKSFHFCESKQ